MRPARLRSVLRLPAAERARAVEAAVLFHAFRALVRVVPRRRLRPLFGEEGPPDAVPAAPPAPPRAVREVRRALERACRATPDTCLAQALAGRAMLRRRGLPSTLSLGVRRHDGELAFHAWLRAGGVLVNGSAGPGQYRVLSTFYDRPRNWGTTDRGRRTTDG